MDINFDGALKNTQGHLTFVSRKWNKHSICTMKSVFVAIRVVLFITKTCPCNIEKKKLVVKMKFSPENF